jgi:hypothetical protein
MVIVVITVVSLHRVTDASKMYHGVRGQETIKLYVLFNVLEVSCASFPRNLATSQPNVFRRIPSDCGSIVLLVWTRSLRFTLFNFGAITFSFRPPFFPTFIPLHPLRTLRNLALPRPVLSARNSQCRSKFLLERAIDSAPEQSICRDQR